ncbi:MAG: protein-glutamate O-methyltransferase [Candidatus Omnitrophota bacterium]
MAGSTLSFNQTREEDERRSSFFSIPPMSDKEFKSLQKIIYDTAGIDIKESKKYLLINRLSKRLRNLGLRNFTEYLSYLDLGERRNQEIVEFIDAVTTNKTEFFREYNHFQFMQNPFLPDLLKNRPASPIRIWSSACSSGEEPYSIAIFMSELIKYPWKLDILASDISETILRAAVQGIYDESKLKPVHPNLLRKYFLKGSGRYKIRPEIANLISFKKINLKLDYHRSLSNFDIVFCRNVLIYFNHDMQNQIINKHWQVLRPGGYLFLGHSETLFGTHVNFQYVAPSIYRKAEDRK